MRNRKKLFPILAMILMLAFISLLIYFTYTPEVSKEPEGGVTIQDQGVPLSESAGDTRSLNDRALISALKKHETGTVMLDSCLELSDAERYKYEFYALHPEVSLYYSPKFTLRAYDRDSKLCIGYRVVFTSETGGKQRIEELESAAGEIVKEAGGMTTSDKVSLVSQWIKARSQYTEKILNMWDACMYGCIVKGSATCLGYSEAMLYMMDRLDVPCRIVVSKHHAWNEVLVDGEWITVDLTRG